MSNEIEKLDKLYIDTTTVGRIMERHGLPKEGLILEEFKAFEKERLKELEEQFEMQLILEKGIFRA